MEKDKVVYVAGAISDPSLINALTNIRKGIKVAARFIKCGVVPFCPFLDYQYSFFEDITLEEYKRYSMEFLRRADFVYVLKDWQHSSGTKAEIQEAQKLRIPIYYQEDFSVETFARIVLK